MTGGRKKEAVLIVEDDRSLRQGLAMNLRAHGYEVATAADGEEGMRLAFDAKPDLVIMDIMLPHWSGLDILEELRGRGKDTPVLILSARSKISDKVEGLNVGADDYLAKPFDLSELIARVQAMLRRRQADEKSAPGLKIGDIVIDRASRNVRIGNRQIALSAREFDLLCLLAASPGQVFTREAVLEQLWGWDYEGTERTVDNFVASLRKKLEASRIARKLIRTVPKVGYKLEPPG